MPRQYRQNLFPPIPFEMLVAASLAYRGGYIQKVGNGYVREYCPTHPSASRRGLVLQHRLVVERSLGRLLERNEVVHHINGDKSDNRLENLSLFQNHADHVSGHHKKTRDRVATPELVAAVRSAAADPKRSLFSLGIPPATVSRICRDHGIEWVSARTVLLSEDRVRIALSGRSTAEAARVLGCHPQTLYNKFPHLLQKRQRPNFLDDHRGEVCKISTESGLCAAARHFLTDSQTVRKAIVRWSKEDATLLELAKTRNRPWSLVRKAQGKAQP